jgi:hypothetical protein
MYLTIYFLFLGLAIVLLAFGYLLEGQPNNPGLVFKIIAYGMFFMINIVPLFGGGVTYQAGNYVEEVNSTHVVRTAEYSTYNEFYIFLFLTLLGGYGGTLFVMEEYRNWKLRYERSL